MKNWLFGIAALFTLIFIGSCGSPCDNVECVNGQCIDGICDCERGYTGEKCDEELTPAFVKISTVTVTKFPFTPRNDAYWDLDDESGADLVIRISDNSKVYYKNTDIIGVKDNAEEGVDHVFPVNVRIEKLDNDIIFQIEDFDVDDVTFEDTYQFMYSFKKKLSDHIAGFPSTITFTDDRAEIVLAVTYAFN
ncbi:MAG: calcium-binding EGF-like domain-containing protein [Bacteroidetes bacterium]|nr:calcium-binding EGF-like domain-containing protein [Bacteroidota bacterium]